MDDQNDFATTPKEPDEIGSGELTEALNSLHLLSGDLYLGMQATNLTLVDQFIMQLESHTLSKLIEYESTPSEEAAFLSAQTQMWIFAVYELLRTWRARAKEVIKLAENGGLKLKASKLDEDIGYIHVGRNIRANQLRQVAEKPDLINRIKIDMRRSHIPFVRLEYVRVSLAKHEIRGKNNSIAQAPGYARINRFCGSLEYQIENGPVVLDTISRRDIADEIRILNDTSKIPTQDDIDSFDAFMKYAPSKEEMEGFLKNDEKL